MSRYQERPLDLSELRTRALVERESKVSAGSFATPYEAGSGLLGFWRSVPRLLAGSELRELSTRILLARKRGKPVILGFGGHVVKCGLGPLVIDLVRRGYVTALATNGSGAIHDCEVAMVGHTSEDVAAKLRDGTFGSARETQELFVAAVSRADSEAIGLGEALGAALSERNPAYRSLSVTAVAYELAIPLTVHVAIGTDTVHLAPDLDPGKLGAATHHDLRLLATLVAALDGGGVYLNVGSAVVLPEVFLKAITAVRNLGGRVQGLVTANLDFIQHYRPRENVLRRPTMDGGRSFALTGHHELLLPMLAAMLIEPEEAGHVQSDGREEKQ